MIKIITTLFIASLTLVSANVLAQEETVWLKCDGSGIRSNFNGTYSKAITGTVAIEDIYVFDKKKKNVFRYNENSKTIEQLPFSVTNAELIMDISVGPNSAGNAHSRTVIDRRSMNYEFHYHWDAPNNTGSTTDANYSGKCAIVDPMSVESEKF